MGDFRRKLKEQQTPEEQQSRGAPSQTSINESPDVGILQGSVENLEYPDDQLLTPFANASRPPELHHESNQMNPNPSDREAPETPSVEVVFHECDSTPHENRDDLLPPNPIDINQELFAANEQEHPFCSINPTVQFPMTHEDISACIKHAKAGDKCTVAWTFDCQGIINV